MRIVILLVMMVGFIYANSSMQIKKGWQLIGVPTSLDVQTSFNNKNVEIVWGFEALTQSWSGYSPDEAKNYKIIEEYTQLYSIESFAALWVFSNNDWTLDIPNVDSLAQAANSTIVLQEGWNLVAIPQKTVVSDRFFGDAIVWKYTQDEEWSVNSDLLDFPSLNVIKESDGLWVKSDKVKIIDIDEQSSKLNTFESREDMLGYIRNMLNMNQYYSINYSNTLEDAVAVTATSDSAKTGDNITSTNLQESGVDEGDIVKHDGTNIFSVDNQNSRIIVSSFDNLSQQIYTPITHIDFSKKSILSIYLQDSRLSVISNVAYLYDKNFTSQVSNFNNFVLDVFDVSDINNINKIATHTIEGRYQDSRLIDGKLYLISQYSPQVEYEYPKVYVETVCKELVNKIDLACREIYTTTGFTSGSKELDRPNCEVIGEYEEWTKNACYQYNYDEQGAWKYDYENPNVVSENLLPTIISNNKSAVELVNNTKFYAPNKLNQRASITTLSSFSIESGVYITNSSFLGNTHTYYASLTALYLVSSEYPMYYDYTHYKDQQMIYKFLLDDTLSYSGRGAVEGRMLNQFSMSEKDDYLRVATTSGWSWWGGGEVSNSVYTLKELDNALKIEGSLTNLGHEGETIRAVRFVGDRGFVVTFKQTDPLYTLDMSDPTEPKIVGELSIPGFSTYLHIIDENRVLSIGRNADDEGRQLELQFQLFDISDFSNPILADKMQIGDKNSYSEAEYNHKALVIELMI